MEIIKRKQKDYANGKIYMIRCNTTKHIYIGSTTKRYLSERLGEHNAQYKCWTGGKTSYVASFDIIKNNNYVILLVELYPCKSNDELRMREQYHIDLNLDCFNRHRAYISEEQKKENDKERIKEYREAHKEHIKEYNKEYKENNKEHLKEHIKEYREAHKEHINQKHDCTCGGKYTTQNLSTHLKSKKHVNSLTQ